MDVPRPLPAEPPKFIPPANTWAKRCSQVNTNAKASWRPNPQLNPLGGCGTGPGHVYVQVRSAAATRRMQVQHFVN